MPLHKKPVDDKVRSARKRCGARREVPCSCNCISLHKRNKDEEWKLSDAR